MEPFQGFGDHVSPGPVPGEAEVAAAAGGDELGGGGEQPKPQAAGFPEPGFTGQHDKTPTENSAPTTSRASIPNAPCVA